MSRFLKPSYQCLEAYVPGEQPRDMQYIKLNTNESPFPPAPSVQQVMDENEVALLRLYSDPTCKTLKTKLAKLYDVQPENIYLSNGSDDILNFAFMAFGQNGAVFPDISYGFYKVFGDLHGVDYTQIPLQEDFSVNYRDYCGVNKLVVIANPNAPTGMQLPVAHIEKILVSNPDSVVLIDEAYVDFGGESCYPLIEKYDNLLVVRTFSKSRCLAGARLGYAIGSKGIIDDLEKIKYSTNPYNVNRMTLRVGEATVDAEPYYQELCREIARVRETTKKGLESMGFIVLPSKANFLFAMCPGREGKWLYENLKAKGILVRHFEKPRIHPYIRITIGSSEQMEKFLCVINELTQEDAT